MDCFRWARKEIGTAPFPKAKEYQKLMVGAYGQEGEERSDSEIDLYTTDEEETDRSDNEAEDSEVEEDFGECGQEEVADEEPEKNWWDSDD
jgi:hypothetical protein